MLLHCHHVFSQFIHHTLWFLCMYFPIRLNSTLTCNSYACSNHSLAKRLNWINEKEPAWSVFVSCMKFSEYFSFHYCFCILFLSLLLPNIRKNRVSYCNVFFFRPDSIIIIMSDGPRATVTCIVYRSVCAFPIIRLKRMNGRFKLIIDNHLNGCECLYTKCVQCALFGGN